MWFKKIFHAFDERERLLFIFAAAAATISATILLWLGFLETTRVIPVSGGNYSEGLIGQPARINPVIARSDADVGLVRLIFSNINDVADKIDVSQDGKTWKIRLKENLRWHDGEKLTSDDVIFTIRKVQEPETDSPLAGAWQGVTAERLSELEFQLKLSGAYAFFSDTIKNLYILPKHLFADIPATNWELSQYNLKPVGNGPYKFVSYEKRPNGFISAYHLEAWDDYFESGALIRSFDLKFFMRAEDLAKNFNSGQIDGAAGMEPENLLQIKRPYQVLPFVMPNYYSVFINQSKNPALKDASVRRALDLASEKGNIVTGVLGGRGHAVSGPISDFDESEKMSDSAATSSIELARDILDQNSWKKNAEGFREKALTGGNVRLEINLTVPQVNFLIKTAEFLAKSWEEAGFKVNLLTKPTEDILRDAIKNREYEALLFGNVVGSSPDLFAFWHSSERFYPGLNFSLYADKKTDALIESSRQTLDSEKRNGLLKQLQKNIADAYPAIFLYSSNFIYVADRNLHVPEKEIISKPGDRFDNARRWYLKTARALK